MHEEELGGSDDEEELEEEEEEEDLFWGLERRGREEREERKRGEERGEERHMGGRRVVQTVQAGGCRCAKAHSYAPRLDAHRRRRPGKLAIARRPIQPRPRYHLG